MAESQKKSKGRKPKYDYKGEEFLSLVESYAKKGFTDKEIACALGITPQTFSEKKSEIKELSDVLSRARSASCELLSFFVSLCIVHSLLHLAVRLIAVVNCFHFLYLCV